jgi:hypothetical protein
MMPEEGSASSTGAPMDKCTLDPNFDPNRAVVFALLLYVFGACKVEGHFVPIDGTTPPPDVAEADASHPPDGNVGSRVGPISSGQFADLVIGQNNFDSGEQNSGGQSASSLRLPGGVASDGVQLWIADTGNFRVLQWNALPVVDRPIANVVIGQSTMTASTPATTQTTIWSGPVFAQGGRVFVADERNNRVLMFSPVPTSNGAPALLVLGQNSFSASGTGSSASTMYNPSDVWSDGARLVVLDNGNSRVLIWNSIPTSNGQPADVVLGRPAFGIGVSTPPPNPPTSASMAFPISVWSNGTRLYVSDSGNHRVLVWNTFPTTNGAPADFVLGQTTFDVGTPNAGGAIPNAIGLQRPMRAVEAAGALFISDFVNNRVVMHYPIPNTSGEPADAVLGQDNFTSDAVQMVPSGNRIGSPRGIAAAGNKLYVADYLWNRVLRFDLRP